MPTGSASFATSRKDGGEPTGSWRCGREEAEAQQLNEPEQYQLFDTPQYSYRVFVTNLDAPIDAWWVFTTTGGAENLIKEANNDAGLRRIPRGDGHELCALQLAMLAIT